MIFVAQVIDAVNEAVDATGCRGAETCQAGSRCLTHDLWTDLSNQIYSFLSSVSLASLVKEGEGKEHAQRQVGKSNAAELLNFVS
jgi:Rrf2 family iron-sulfur cluster assembly transcriptional regulator